MMSKRYLLLLLLLFVLFTLFLLSRAPEVVQTRLDQIAVLMATDTPAPTNTPLYAPTRTPALATAIPVTASPTVTPVPPAIPTQIPLLPSVEPTTEQPATTTAVSSAVPTTVEPTMIQPTSIPSPTVPLPASTSLPASIFDISYQERFGVSGTVGDAVLARQAGLNYGSFITWNLFDTQRLSADVTAWQMVRVAENGVIGGLERLGEAVRATPGGIFVIGNEPDVEVQDNTTAPSYAEIYHDAYYHIKNVDPTAQVAIAGVGSPTPLRFRYLEIMLDHYEQTYGEKMPIDIWTIHIYVLREERDSWGIGIPTGLDDVDQGTLYEIDDHKDATIANQLLSDFRRWLAEKGYRDTPLAITEFGILLPADYGFPPEVVSNYMTTLVNFYLSAADDTGYSADGDRLVQWWFWFSLLDTDEFEVSNMLDAGNQLTPVGQTYSGYIP